VPRSFEGVELIAPRLFVVCAFQKQDRHSCLSLWTGIRAYQIEEIFHLPFFNSHFSFKAYREEGTGRPARMANEK